MKRSAAIAAGALAALLSAAACAMHLAPYPTHMALRRLALWRGGVKRVAAGPLLAYEKDSCRPGAPCRCVALVHGLGDSAMTWDKTLLGLEGATPPPEGTLLLAVDMPGTDGSSPAADYGIRAQARVLRTALEGRCPQWTVAGNSLGGWISAWLALDWPQGVRRLILVNAAGLTDASGLALQAARTLAEPTVPALKEFNALAFVKARPIPERAWAPAAVAIRARPTRAIFAALKMSDALDFRLKDLRGETVIVWGQGDGVLPAGFAGRFREGIAGARLDLVAGCGHLPQRECPETVSRALFGAKP